MRSEGGRHVTACAVPCRFVHTLVTIAGLDPRPRAEPVSDQHDRKAARPRPGKASGRRQVLAAAFGLFAIATPAGRKASIRPRQFLRAAGALPQHRTRNRSPRQSAAAESAGSPISRRQTWRRPARFARACEGQLAAFDQGAADPGPRRPDQARRRRHRQTAGRPRPHRRASAQGRLRRPRIFRAVLGAVAAMRADHFADPRRCAAISIA